MHATFSVHVKKSNLVTWINFNSSMDNQSNAQKLLGWKLDTNSQTPTIAYQNLCWVLGEFDMHHAWKSIDKRI